MDNIIKLHEQAAEALYEIKSFKRQVKAIEYNISKKDAMFYNPGRWKKGLQFTKKRLNLYVYHYETLIKQINNEQTRISGLLPKVEKIKRND